MISMHAHHLPHDMLNHQAQSVCVADRSMNADQQSIKQFNAYLMDAMMRYENLIDMLSVLITIKMTSMLNALTTSFIRYSIQS